MRRILLVAILALPLIPAVSRGASTPKWCLGHRATIVGTPDQDFHLVGTDGPDVIVGLGGSDDIHGMGGADIICGGPGSERGVNDAGLDGGDGPDIIHGGGYRDELNGGKGRDILFGGKDRDWICDGICNWDPDEVENVVFADTERADMLIGLGGPDTCVVSGPKDVALAC